jgi:hypothetical protein
LKTLASRWKTDRNEILEFGNKLKEALQDFESNLKKLKGLPTEELVSKWFKVCSKRFDPKFGGFGSAPKFPPSQDIRMLLRIYRRAKDARALEMVEKTLKAMAWGGLYDHVGGGFARYSTDEQWMIPRKMRKKRKKRKCRVFLTCLSFQILRRCYMTIRAFLRLTWRLIRLETLFVAAIVCFDFSSNSNNKKRPLAKKSMQELPKKRWAIFFA